MLKESTYQTPCGTIHYWSNNLSLDTTTLVFLPGLTADQRLFDKQVEYFDGKYNIIVWDAPAHASSWPFRFDFDLFDKAKWLNGILEKEEIIKPIIIGQSMGGYVGQAYAQLYPDRLAGFISIDSEPHAIHQHAYLPLSTKKRRIRRFFVATIRGYCGPFQSVNEVRLKLWLPTRNTL